MERLSGSLARTYTATVPAAPGWNQPARHRADAAGGQVTRDDASNGGGWQPETWSTDQVVVLPGDPERAPQGHRRGRPTHHGREGRGSWEVSDAAELDSRDRNSLGDELGRLFGAGGADHGGIMPQGVSEPWAYPAFSRRRADGGVVTRDGTMRRGTFHKHTTEIRHPGLHLNRPTLRFVRPKVITHETSSPYPGGKTSPFNPIARPRTVGPVEPRTRRTVRPYGQVDTVPPALTQSYGGPVGDVIGSGWVM